MPKWDKLDRFEDHYNRQHVRIPEGTRRGSAAIGISRARHETKFSATVKKDEVGSFRGPILQTLLGFAILFAGPGIVNDLSKRQRVIYEQPQILDSSTYPQPAQMPEAPNR